MQLVRQPIAVITLTSTFVVAAAAAGVVFALAATILLLVLGVVCSLGAGPRGRIERMDRRRKLGVRRDRRAAFVAKAGVPAFPLTDLTREVDTITHTSPSDGELFELESLLDYYAVIAVLRDQAQTTVASEAPASVCRPRTEAAGTTFATIQMQRTEAWIALKKLLQLCDHELAAIEDFIHLVALRTSIASVTARIEPHQLDERLLRIVGIDDLSRFAPDPTTRLA